ncbi:hypothetical protein HNR77_001914 [Paenibacillus sp. JGP012]|uniref:hypothetical protein n=1 Tax=Paenibacillus sp. JGP012 TaxID=2735914 RepID=UPI00161FFDE6|nr:hypothetical protein [Paenibacillus sp. JGP012]MBB6020852.1 hypothetical protein [Paenibacillus sp. JGP012]
MNYLFTRERRGQKKPEKAERSPESFLQESYIGSIRLSPDFALWKRESKKSGDNSDWKVVLSSEWIV